MQKATSKKENLVLTISIGKYYEEISEYTLPSIKKYAKKINADFLNITEPDEKFITQKWNKFHISELLNKYKRILYLDIDLIVREDTPNLFDVVPETKLGMFNEGKYSARQEFITQASDYYKEPVTEWNGKFYNSGVMVISRMHKQIFRMPRGIDYVETDQPYINLRIAIDKVNMHDLDYKFNRMDILDKFIGISRLDSYIVHYAGAPRNILFDVLKKDIEQWKVDSPEYKYQRNIVISISAGMGDQLCSEPVIRYTQKIYPDANIIAVTHFPRLFEHLDIPVLKYNDWKGSQEAVLVLYKPLIVVHPGRWWPSKTFPVEWWQEVVDKLSEKLCVGLIGKTIDEKQGYVAIDCPKDGIDFRDLTTLGEMIALISLAKVTLTNDSSPVHIAGAFDNWLVAIPTCKHPDHMIPFRNGTQYYKTKVLYKKLLLDDLEIRHTESYPDTIDTIPVGKSLYDYLPDTDTVVKEIFNIYENEK